MTSGEGAFPSRRQNVKEGSGAMADSYWIWYPGDFELYHRMEQDFSRVERGYGWPAFWKSEGFRNRVVFRRQYVLERDTEFRVDSKAVGFVLVGEKKYPLGQRIACPKGEVLISIHAARIDAFPSVYVEGDVVHSDRGWMAEDYAQPPVPAGYNPYFTRPDQDPARWEYSEREYRPVKTEQAGDGVLYEFETELTAVLRVEAPRERLERLRVYCGESRDEALDTKRCYYSWTPDPETGETPRCAVRFAFIPGEAVELAAVHQFVDIPVRAAFQCGDPLLDRIWSVAAHTFRLCAGIFFIDGVKRDKWIWAGDAYQSLFVNRYLLADPGVEQRTLLALRGNDPMTGHINTIMDYSLLWLLGVKEYFDAYGDRDFLELIWPKAASLLEFCRERTDARGFLTAGEKDWVFIDWADLDKDGPFGAEQMLLCACWGAAAELSEALGRDGVEYRQRRKELAAQIDACYWDGALGAYVDSFMSGRRHVSRQTNLLAVRFGVADGGKRASILKNVIDNPAIPPITTPYFNFFELDVLAACGRLDQVMERLRAYWGGMLERGAVTFWEEFDPSVTGTAQYDMYGDRFGKSLCHAWAASPIYLLARYFVGLSREGDGFALEPRLEYFSALDCTLPVGGAGGFVRVRWDGGLLAVETNWKGGTLWIGGDRYGLPPDGAAELHVRV